MDTHYLIVEGQIVARGARLDLAPLETENRHVVFAPDWDLGISWLQDPDGSILAAMDKVYPPDAPLDMERWNRAMASIKGGRAS